MPEFDVEHWRKQIDALPASLLPATRAQLETVIRLRAGRILDAEIGILLGHLTRERVRQLRKMIGLPAGRSMGTGPAVRRPGRRGRLVGEEVVAIRLAAKGGVGIGELMRQYGLPWKALNDVISGRTYAHLPGAFCRKPGRKKKADD